MNTNVKPAKRKGVYLVGFSGSGKSTIAQLVADQLHCSGCDLDDLIVEMSGMPIPTIFKKEGELGFRQRESEALRAASSRGPFVIATGGGTVVRAENRNFMATNGWVIFLEAQAPVLHARIQDQLKNSDPRAIRPLLDAVYPLDQIRALKHTRQAAYSLADWTIHTDRLTADQVAREVIRAVEILESSPEPVTASSGTQLPLRHSLDPDSPPPITVAAGPWPYQVLVGWEQLSELGAAVKRVLPQAHRAAILTDTNAWSRVAETVEASLKGAGLEYHLREELPAESSKTTNEVSAIHDWLLGLPFRRDDVMIIIGGGAVDDVGGFAASTYMRGVALVKVPTSLEGMVDSSIGGKTALNHPRARNLIGTFYHPRLILTDVSLLLGEPKQDLRPAWAEVVKYAMVEASLLRGQVEGNSLFDQIKNEVGRLVALDRKQLLSIVARCVALKAHVVAGDERDSGKFRILLNYGHTVGHALEAATNYAISHGDAVAIGMSVAAALSVRLGLATPSVATEQNSLLERFGLPTRLPNVSLDLLLDRIHKDKKVFGDAPTWILPAGIGHAVISGAVRESDVISVLTELSE